MSKVRLISMEESISISYPPSPRAVKSNDQAVPKLKLPSSGSAVKKGRVSFSNPISPRNQLSPRTEDYNDQIFNQQQDELLVSPREIAHRLTAQNQMYHQTIYHQPTESGFEEDEEDLSKAHLNYLLAEAFLTQQVEIFYMQTLFEHPTMANTDFSTYQVWERFKHAAENAITFNWVTDRSLQFNPAEREVFNAAIASYHAAQAFHTAYYLVLVHDRGHTGRANAVIQRNLNSNNEDEKPKQEFLNPFIKYGIEQRMIRLHPNPLYQRAIPELSDNEFLVVSEVNIWDKMTFDRSQVKLEEPLKKICYGIAKKHRCSWKKVKLYLGYEPYSLDPGTTFYKQQLQYGTIIFFKIES